MLIIQILFIVLGIASLVSMVFLLISAFKRSILWGIVVLLLSPIAAIIYGIKYFNEVKKPFLVYLGTTICSFAFLVYFFLQLGGMEAISVASKINDGSLTEQDAAKFMMNTMEGMEEMTGQSKEDIIAQMQQDPNVTPEQIEQAKQLFNSIEGLASGEISSLEDAMQQPTKTQIVKSETPAANAELNGVEQDLQQAIAKLKQEIEAAKEINLQAPDGDNVVAPVIEEVVEVEENKTQSLPTAAYQMRKEKAPVVTKISVDQAKKYIDKTVTTTMKAGNQRSGRLIKVDGGQLWFEQKAFSGSLTYKLMANDIESMEISN